MKLSSVIDARSLIESYELKYFGKNGTSNVTWLQDRKFLVLVFEHFVRILEIEYFGVCLCSNLNTITHE